jgi:flagellar basal-body rod protein FlgB
MTPTVSQIDLLARVMDVAALRHRAVAQNLANLNTPFYQRVDVSFEDDMASLLGSGASGAPGKPHLVQTEDAPVRGDGNTVSMEQEISILNKNTLLYNATAQILASRLGTMRAAISGR